MSINPDKIFAKIILAKPLTLNQKNEVKLWIKSNNPDELVAWTFDNIRNYRKKNQVIKTACRLLILDNLKSKLNILVVIMMTPPYILKSGAIRKGIYACSRDNNASVRANSIQILARLAAMGYSESQKLLLKAKEDPDVSVRTNAIALFRKE